MSYKKKDLKIPTGILRVFGDWGKYHKYFGLFFDLSKYKGCEVNVYLSLALHLSASIAYTTKCDHAGLRLELVLFGLTLEINAYDSRHWNDKANRWYNEGEEQADIEANGPKIKLGNVDVD